MKSVELFSGAGGLAKGLATAGFRHSLLIDINKNACNTLQKNFLKTVVHCGDVQDYSFSGISNISLVSGGPPCQPFSLGGKHKSSSDLRNMFPYAIQAIATINPKVFIFENVKGLLRKSFQDYFNYIILCLSFPQFSKADGGHWETHYQKLLNLSSKSGASPRYNVQFKLLNAADYGVPQVRERVIIVGVRSDIKKTWKFPDPTHSKEQLLWSQHVTGEYWRRHKIKPTYHVTTQYSLETDRSSSHLLPWLTVRDALTDLPDPIADHTIADHVFRAGAKAYQGHTGSFIDLPSKTIKAGNHGVPGGENMLRDEHGQVRYFTVHEAKLLQTFPSNFTITGSWSEALRQIGNAVPVKLAHVLGEEIRKVIEQ